MNTDWAGGFADLHNHPGDMPRSSGDLYGLINTANNHSGYNTRMVFAPDGSMYALVVINLAAANAFVAANPAVNSGFGPDFSTTIYADFDAAQDDLFSHGEVHWLLMLLVLRMCWKNIVQG